MALSYDTPCAQRDEGWAAGGGGGERERTQKEHDPSWIPETEILRNQASFQEGDRRHARKQELYRAYACALTGGTPLPLRSRNIQRLDRSPPNAVLSATSGGVSGVSRRGGGDKSSLRRAYVGRRGELLGTIIAPGTLPCAAIHLQALALC